jgi:hypothetical protein
MEGSQCLLGGYELGNVPLMLVNLRHLLRHEGVCLLPKSYTMKMTSLASKHGLLPSVWGFRPLPESICLILTLEQARP